MQPGIWLLNTRLGCCRGDMAPVPQMGAMWTVSLWPLPAEGPGADPRTAGGSWGQAATPAWPRRRPRRKHAGVGGAWGGEPGHPGAIGGQPAVWAPRAPRPASGNRPLLSSPTATGRPVGPCAGPTPTPVRTPKAGRKPEGRPFRPPTRSPASWSPAWPCSSFRCGPLTWSAKACPLLPAQLGQRPPAPRTTSPGPRGSVVVRGARRWWRGSCAASGQAWAVWAVATVA